MIYRKIPTVLHIGFATEQYSRRPGIDISEMLEQLPDGVPQLFVVRPGESEAKPVTVTLEGTTLYWEVNGYDTRRDGRGAAQVILSNASDPSAFLQSHPIRVFVAKTILPDGEDVPEPYESWVAQIAALAAGATQSAAAAAQSAEDADASKAAALEAQGAAEDARDSALDSKAAAAQSEGNADASSKDSKKYADRSEVYYNLSRMQAATGGFMHLVNKNGRIYCVRTANCGLEMRMVEGRLQYGYTE